MQTSGLISQIVAALGIALAGTVLAQRAGSEAPEPGEPAPVAAAAATVQAGQVIDPKALHDIRRPGLYGMTRLPEGSRYGVLDGQLIRYDPGTLRVQSVIRPAQVVD